MNINNRHHQWYYKARSCCEGVLVIMRFIWTQPLLNVSKRDILYVYKSISFCQRSMNMFNCMIKLECIFEFSLLKVFYFEYIQRNCDIQHRIFLIESNVCSSHFRSHCVHLFDSFMNIDEVIWFLVQNTVEICRWDFIDCKSLLKVKVTYGSNILHSENFTKSFSLCQTLTRFPFSPERIYVI